MTEQSRRGPEKQRAPLAPSREPLVPEERQAEELEARAATTAARAAMAAAGAASGPPPGITPSAALSLARRVGNRRFGQWAARQRNAHDVAGQARGASPVGDESLRVGPSPMGQVIAGATAIVTPPAARSRSAALSRAWDETGIKLGSELTPGGTMPNPFDEQGMKLGPEIGPGGTMPNPFEEQKKWGYEVGPEHKLGPELSTGELMPNPFVEQGEKQGPELSPGALMPNPFEEQKKWGPEIGPGGLMPNPFEEQGKKWGPELTPSGTMPNPFADTKAGVSADAEAQGTVTQMEHEATALEGRDAQVLGHTPVSEDHAVTQAEELASTGQVQAATEDHTAREEAATEEEAAIEHEASAEETPMEHEVPLDPGAEQALQRVRQLLESTVLPLVAMLNPVGGVLAALRAVGGAIVRTARFLDRALTPVWRTITSGIGGVVSAVTERAASMLSAARRAAETVVNAVTSVLGPPAEAALARIQQLRAAAYGRVVQMVRSAREQGVSRLASMVGDVTTLISSTGQQIREAITQAANAVANAVRAARDAARGELDRMLGRSGPPSSRQTGQVRARLRSWAQRRLQALPRAVASGRESTVSALRTALNDAVGIAREVWSEAASGFREMFAAPIAQAREHVPDLVGEVELGAEQGEGLFGQATGIADQELAGVEQALVAAETQLQTEADQTGQSL